jgi:lysyl-tRNA synthetase class 2
MSKDELSQVLNQRRRKAQALLDEGVSLYPNNFRVEDHLADIRNHCGGLDAEALARETRVFTVAGRIVAMRSFGQAAFVTLQDATARLQAYVKKDQVGEGLYRIFKRLDLGDLVGVTGTVFRTRTGELTLLARDVRLITKSLRPLPEKFHGLRDVESR